MHISHIFCIAQCPDGLEDVHGVCAKKGHSRPAPSAVQTTGTSPSQQSRQTVLVTTAASPGGGGTAMIMPPLSVAKREICPRRGEVPYVERGKLRFCQPAKRKATCPGGFSCQLSALIKKFLCCGKPHKHTVKSLVGGVEVERAAVAPAEEEAGGDNNNEGGTEGEVRRQTDRSSRERSRELTREIAAGSWKIAASGNVPAEFATTSASVSQSPPSQVSRPASVNRRLLEGICERGIPLMVNGRPQTCTATVCPSDYHCVFSKRARNYYCCSKANIGEWHRTPPLFWFVQ